MARKKTTSLSTSTDEPGDNTPSRLQSRQGTKSRTAISISDCDTELLARTMERLTEAGALVSFSKTSDGGAIHMRVLDGDDIAKEYAATREAFDALLLEFYELYE